MRNQIIPRVLFLTCFFPFVVSAQLTVNGGLTAVQLAQIMAGPNITINSATLTGGAAASGSFDGTSSNIGMTGGVILSNGDIGDAPGPNNSNGGNANLGEPGTAQMDSMAGAISFDAITLEFSFNVQSDFIQFQYIFASEEYPEYAPPNSSSFNDVFAFFISGPGIAGEENIALVPGTASSVAINNINAVTNNQYYIDNAGGATVQYDAWTTILTAERQNLIPCQEYTMKLVIADAGDADWSSAVFLLENSFIQGVVDVNTQTVNADNIALEGCIPAQFNFSLDLASATNTNISYQIGGSATNGIDYQFIDTLVTIPAGDTAASIIINAFSDGFPEGQESIYIIFQTDLCSPPDTAFLYIDDAQPIEFTLDGTNLSCFDNSTGEILVNASGGFPPYTYQVTDDAGNGSMIQYGTSPVTGLEAGIYSVQVYDIYGCKAEALVIGGIYDADTTFLPDGSGVSYISTIPISGFDNGQTLDNMTQLQQICATMEHSYLGDLQIKVISPTGQEVILKEFNGGGSCDLGEPFASDQVDGANSNLIDPGIGFEYCWNAAPIYLTMVQESNNYTHTIPSSTGGTYTDNFLPQGSYASFENLNALLGSDLNGNWDLEVSDQFNLDNGYIFSWNVSLVSDLPDTLVTITEPEEMAISGFITQAQCGGTDGGIDLSVSGEFPPFTFLWSSGETTEDLTGIGAGTYTVNVTDGNGCSDSATFNLNNISSINITSNITSVTCSGGLNGAIDVTTSGGTSPYTFAWNSGEATEDIGAIGAGLYTLTISDASGCQFSEDIEVSTLPGMSIALDGSTNEVCSFDNGSIDVSVTGGSGSYGYSWDNGATTEDLANIGSGTYTLTVTDANSCSVNNSFSIINDVSNCSAYCYLNISNNQVSDESCGDETGSIDITVLDATSPYVVSWDNGSTTDDISSLSAGTYTVTVLDANQCELIASFTVGNNAGTLEVSSNATSNENCGNNDGTIDVVTAGGAGPYAYAWSNGATTEDVTGLAAGTYDVTINDNAGCTINEIFTVGNNVGTMNESAGVSNEICGNGGGTINLSVTGGVTPYSYLWSNGSTNEDQTLLSAGIYSATITDGVGCTLNSVDYTVTNSPTDLTILSIDITNENCNDEAGAIDINVINGTLPYTYTWSNSAVTEDLSGLIAGVYGCVILDNNGCQVETGDQTVFNQGGSLSVSTISTTDEVCGDATGQIDVDVAGGTTPYTFSWDNGATTEDITGLSTGAYVITVTDAAGCATSYTESIQDVSPGFNVSITSTIDEVCGDGTGAIDITVIGGANPVLYAWSNGSTTEDVSSLNAGLYMVSVTDNNGCELDVSATIQGQGITVGSASISDEICGNASGSIDISFSGGVNPYSFAWSNGAITEDISGLTAGTYALTLTGAGGCSYSDSYTVGNNTSGLAITSTTAIDEDCGDGNGAINVSTTGGVLPLLYNWDNGDITEDLSGLSAGLYVLTIEDANGCSVGTSGTVVNNAAGFAASISAVADETCGDASGAIDVDVTGGSLPYTYVWDSGETTEDISGVSEGTYEFTVTDNNSCSIVLQETVNNITGTLAVANAVIGDASCTSLNGYIDLTITGGSTPYTFAWDNGQSTEDISGMPPGIYNCTVIDNAGCIVNYTGTINSTGGLITTNAIITDDICGNAEGQIDVTVTGGISPFAYSWTGASPSTCCDYTLDMFDASTSWNGATVTVLLDGISIGDFTVFGGGANNETFTACDGQSVELIWSAGAFDNEVSFDLLGPSGAIIFAQGPSPTPGLLFTTTGSCPGGANNETSISNLNSGTYQLTITDNVGCEIIENYAVQNELPNLQLTTTSIVDDQCLQNQGQIIATAAGASAPLEFTLDGNPDGFQQGQFNNLTVGTYTLMVEDGNGCQESIPVTIANQSTFAMIVVAIDDENCGFSDGTIDIDVTGTGTNFSYTWSNGATTQDIIGLAAGSYTCNISDLDNFCDDNITVDVLFNPGFTLQSLSTDENCGDGSGGLDLTATGGALPITYSWDNGATTEDISGLSEGDYTVTATDNLGCVVELQDMVFNNTGTLSVSDVITDEICGNGGGTIDLSVTGGTGPYTFAWSNSETTEDIVGLSVGNYTCSIIDDAGCVLNYSGDINDTFGGMTTDTVIVDETCNQSNGAINVTVNGGIAPYTFSWTGATPNPCCSYTLDMEDTFGDGWDGAFVTVLINGSPIGDFTVNAGDSEIASIPVCDGESIEIIYTAGNFEEEHLYTLYDGQGNAVFADGTDPSTGSVYTGNAACSGTVNETSISNLFTGSYDLTITDNSGCSLTQTYLVQAVVSSLDLILTNITDDQCLQSQAQIQAASTGGVAPVSYTLDGQPDVFGGNFFGVAAGDYLLMAEDNEGCQDTMTITVGNQSTFTTTIVTTTDENCGNSDGAIDIDVAGSGTNFSYSWNNGATTQDLSGLAAGTYTCIITDIDNTCDDEVSVELINTADFTVSTSIVNESCGDGAGSIDLTITGGSNFTFIWSNGATTEDLSSLVSGNYTCLITDGTSGCTFNIDADIMNATNGMAVSTSYNDENCGDGNGSINVTVSGGSGNYSYNWNSGETTEDLSGLEAGAYSVIVTDDTDGCSIVETIIIGNNANYTISGVVNNSTCSTCTDGSIDVSIVEIVPDGPYTYSWNSGETTQDISGLLPGTYTLTITGASGCTITESFVVENSVAITSLSNDWKLSVYPNPAKDQFVIDFNFNSDTDVRFEMLDMIGQLIEDSTIQGNVGKRTIDASRFESGIYLLRFTNGKTQEIIRVNISK